MSTYDDVERTGMSTQDGVRTAQATATDPPQRMEDPGAGQGEPSPGRAQASDELRTDPLATAQALQTIVGVCQEGFGGARAWPGVSLWQTAQLPLLWIGR